MSDELIEGFLATGRLGRVKDRPAAERLARSILCRIVAWRARRAPLRLGVAPQDLDARVVALCRPMVEGLLGPEAAVVLPRLPACVRVVTPATYPALVEDVPLETAWDLANLLLDGMGAPTLSDDAPTLDGLSHATIGYVLPEAFRAGDVLVHELAHVLHSVPRRRFDLAPADAPVLRVPPARRETFAWACEWWARCERAADPVGAAAIACAGPAPEDARVDAELLARTLRAAASGAGWSAVRGLVGR